MQVASTCPDCKGARLNKRARSILLQGRSFSEFLSMTIGQADEFLNSKLLSDTGFSHVGDALEGLAERLKFLREVGLHYLALDRRYSTLSGGEMQRLRLATQLGMGLVGVVYVLDEPSIGLHPVDNQRLINSMTGLRDRGNSVLVVEHDPETMLAADTLIELGPGAGAEGGQLLFNGSPELCCIHQESRTGAYLSGRAKVERNSS